ncbi:MAG: rod shape-determining protein MreD [Atopobiaceae bacterium]|jgi:rod shape-determining protein MreD
MQVSDQNKESRTIGILALVCALLQLGIVPLFGIGDGRANLALVFAGLMAFMFGGRRGVLLAFLAGVFFDLTTTGPIGIMAFELPVMAFLLGSESRNRLIEDRTESLKEFAIGSLAVGLVYGIVMLFLGQAGSLVDVVFLRVIPTFALTFVAFAAFAYFLSGGSSGGRARGPRRAGMRSGGRIRTKGL